MADNEKQPGPWEGAKPSPDPGAPRIARVEEVEQRQRVASWRWALAGVLAFMLVGAAVLWIRCGINGCPNVETLRGYMPDEASVVLDREGAEVAKLYITRRVVVPLDSLGSAPSAMDPPIALPAVLPSPPWPSASMKKPPAPEIDPPA